MVPGSKHGGHRFRRTALQPRDVVRLRETFGDELRATRCHHRGLSRKNLPEMGFRHGHSWLPPHTQL